MKIEKSVRNNLISFNGDQIQFRTYPDRKLNTRFKLKII